MMRRLTLILMTVLLAVGLVSCDLSAVMQKMGENIAGANPGKINAVTDKIDETWDDETSVEPLDSNYTLGGISLDQFIAQAGIPSGTKIIAPLGETEFKELASSIGVAASTSQGSAALTKQLSKPLDEKTDAAKIEATEGTAEVFKGILMKMADVSSSESDIRGAVKKNLNLDESAGNEDAEIMQTLLGLIVDGVFDIVDQETEVSDGVYEPYKVTQGDLLFMQSLFTVVDQLGEDVFDPSKATADNPFPVREDLSEMDPDVLNGIIDNANAGLQVLDAVAPASAFKGMDISSVLNSLMEGMENSESEGGSN